MLFFLPEGEQLRSCPVAEDTPDSPPLLPPLFRLVTNGLFPRGRSGMLFFFFFLLRASQLSPLHGRNHGDINQAGVSGRPPFLFFYPPRFNLGSLSPSYFFPCLLIEAQEREKRYFFFTRQHPRLSRSFVFSFLLETGTLFLVAGKTKGCFTPFLFPRKREDGCVAFFFLFFSLPFALMSEECYRRIFFPLGGSFNSFSLAYHQPDLGRLASFPPFPSRSFLFHSDAGALKGTMAIDSPPFFFFPLWPTKPLSLPFLLHDEPGHILITIPPV